MPSATPRRAFTTLVRNALASARASRLVRPLHAKVKQVDDFEGPSVSNRYDFNDLNPQAARVDVTPLTRADLFTSWREPRTHRGTAKLPSFRFPAPEVRTGRADDVSAKKSDSDVTSASVSASANEADANEQLRQFAHVRRDPVLANALGEEFGARAMRAFHSPVRKHLTLDPLISEYSVDSPEGVALMSLAEALIRVPNGAGAYMPDRLIRDTIGQHDLDFMSHLQGDKSALVNASSVALAAVKKVVGFGSQKNARDATQNPNEYDPPSQLVDFPLRVGVTKAIGLLSNKFTMGDTIQNALKRARRNEVNEMKNRGAFVSHSFDVLGEGARTFADADKYLTSYQAAAHHIEHSGVNSPQMSIKLSSLSPRFDELSRNECVDDLSNKLSTVLPSDHDSPLCVFIDAEEQNRLELTLSVLEETLRKRYVGDAPPASIGIVVQAYGRRAMDALEFLKTLAVKYPATEIRVRLVKGAYWDSEMKEAQVVGADMYPVWTEKRMTDVSYLACAAFLLENIAYLPKPAFATHNARTVADIIAMCDGVDNFSEMGCEFQRLHGMGESFDYAGLPTRVYSPVGKPDDLLAYLIRRLLENGANSSFLKSLAQKRDDLMNVDVLQEFREEMIGEGTDGTNTSTLLSSGLPNSPRDVYGGLRLSARGMDFERPSFPGVFALTDSFRPDVKSFQFRDENDEAFKAMLSKVKAQKFVSVSGDSYVESVKRRANALDKAADLIENDTVAFSKMIMEEAGKTLLDAGDEVRECVDFFRFYASRARATLLEPRSLPTVTGESCLLRAQPRGPWLCVGPFNFPFAIVGGLVSSAFVAGNPVVIKPHPKTPRCAMALADVMQRAGALDNDIRVVLDDDKNGAGAALIKSGAFAGVSFVGSSQVAARINLSLAQNAVENDAPLARLVAETGGLNALVVDASALPEQACDAVLRSFAQSAGQRCSSARVLILDNGVKHELLDMLSGGLQAMRVSADNLNCSTDVGPLISTEAAQKAVDHCIELEANGSTLVAKTIGSDDIDNGLFHPRVYDLNPSGQNPVDALSQITQELFAPVLHVLTYDGSRIELRNVLDAMNAKGFALTGGVMTRCASTKALVTDTLNCGNFYVNRDVVGAVVESQPFGGHGLSGNGAKAGSENYLEQFVARKVVCEDTTAAGGNVELMRTTAA